MLIKGPSLRKTLLTGIKRPQSKSILVALFVTLMVLLQAAGVYSVVGWTRGAVASSGGLTQARQWIRSRGSRPRQLHLDIKFKDYQKLAFFRERALEEGVLRQTEDSFVPASIRLEGKEIPVKVRLKGDVTNHLEGDKWSLRIRVKGEGAVFGLKHFSIQDPARSAYIHEWILHRMLNREGLIGLRYDFIEVTINGKDAGVFALEESFGKELLGANRRREGPIIRFDESYLWDPEAWAHQSIPGQADVFFASEVDAFESGKIAGSPELSAQFNHARALLEGFRDRRLSVKDAFDVERTAALLAIMDLTTSWHAMRWKNVRFYYNPVTGRLEPIAYNAYDATIDPQEMIYAHGPASYKEYTVPEWVDTFLRDPDLYDAYVKALDRIARPGFLEEFFEDLGPDLDEKLRIIHRDNPEFAFSRKVYFDNRDLITRVLRSKVPIQVAFEPKDLRLLVANTGHLGIELLGIIDETTGVEHRLPAGLRVGPKQAAQPRFVALIVPGVADLLSGFEEGRFRIKYRVAGLEEGRSVPIRAASQAGALSPPRRDEGDVARLEEHPAFEVDRGRRVIAVRPGSWTIDSTVVIPAGHTLTCGPGTRLELRHGASLLSSGPVKLEGRAGRPVVIESPDGSGGGLAVLGAGQESAIRHAVFRNLSLPSGAGGGVTGAVTFYESPVTISHATFEGSHVEDLLNIVRSRFEIRSSTFQNGRNDCLDVDFGNGRLADSRFLNCGNDAIDISGSEVLVESTRVEGARDKALSVGEGSSVRVAELSLSDCGLGLVSKDLSTLSGTGVRISDCRYGVGAYQKKPEFGPATVELRETTVIGASADLRVEKGSRVVWNGSEHRGLELDLAKELYDN